MAILTTPRRMRHQLSMGWCVTGGCRERKRTVSQRKGVKSVEGEEKGGEDEQTGGAEVQLYFCRLDRVKGIS
jgi:hypothetical protein